MSKPDVADEHVPVPVALIKKADGEWHPTTTSGRPDVIWLVLHEDGSVSWVERLGDE